MPYESAAAVIPYEVAFVVVALLTTVLTGPKLARASRILIVLYAPFAFILSVYFLTLKKSTWQVGHTLPDATRYSRATRRSSAAYLITNLILLAGAKMLGVPYDNVNFNFISLFVTTLLVYIYDRAVATDDGLEHLKQNPLRTVFDAYLSLCSPSFMRYIMVLVCDITLTVLIGYYVGRLIPPHCWVASALFKKSIVPVLVFSIVGGPLRFAWAYPTVSEAGRIPYLLVYTIVFTLLAILTYASGSFNPASIGGVLILAALIATLLQIGGLSNAPSEPDVIDDASIMPRWIMAIFATIILVCVLVVSYRVFINCLQPFLGIGSTANVQGGGRLSCTVQTHSRRQKSRAY